MFHLTRKGVAVLPMRKKRKRSETSMGRLKETRVKDVMSRDLVTVTERTSIKELHRLFKVHDYNILPVVKGDRLMGVVSKLDLLRVVSIGLGFSLSRYWTTFAKNVGDVMNHAVITVDPEDTIDTAVDYMVEYGLRSIPVVHGRRLVGVVSWKDLMEHLTLNQDDL